MLCGWGWTTSRVSKHVTVPQSSKTDYSIIWQSGGEAVKLRQEREFGDLTAYGPNAGPENVCDPQWGRRKGLERTAGLFRIIRDVTSNQVKRLYREGRADVNPYSGLFGSRVVDWPGRQPTEGSRLLINCLKRTPS